MTRFSANTEMSAKVGDDAQQQERGDDRQPTEQRRQQGGHERAEEQQREQEDQREGQELGVREVVADLRVGLGVGDLPAAQRHVALAGEAVLDVLRDVLERLVRQRLEVGHDVGGTSAG